MSSTPHLVMVQSFRKVTEFYIQVEGFFKPIFISTNLRRKDNTSPVRSELYNVLLITNLVGFMPIIFYSFSNP